MMKETAFPVYILLVIAFFACLQSDETLTGKALTSYSPVVMVKQARFAQNSYHTRVILVNPSGAKIYSSYKLNGAIQFSLMQDSQCCDASAYLNRQYE